MFGNIEYFTDRQRMWYTYPIISFGNTECKSANVVFLTIFQEVTFITTKKARVLSVEKAFSILKLFQNNEALSLNEISELMALPKTTAFGLIATIESQCFLEQDPVSGKYRLGPAVIELASSMHSSMNLKQEAVVALRKLSEKYKKNTHITMLSGMDILYVESVIPYGIMMASTVIGAKAPANCTSSGKAFLAALSEKELEQLLSLSPLRGLTPNSITDQSVLKRELHKIRHQGYAVDDEESLLGIRGVGMVVVNQMKKPIFGISMAGLTSYMRAADMGQYIEELRAIADHLSARAAGRLP